MSFHPYPYQETCIREIVTLAQAGARSILLVSATGSGKTMMIGEAARRLKLNLTAVAHRVEIKKQLKKSFDRLGVNSIVATIGSKSMYQALEKSSGFFIDEAHHAAAMTYQKALSAARSIDQLVLGATATPYRQDGVSLQKDFDAIVTAPSISELVAQGYLARIKYIASTDVDFNEVRRTVQAEFVAEDAFRKVRVVVQAGDILRAWQKYAPGRKAIIYCCNQEHCELVERELLEANVMVKSVTSRTATKDRSNAIRAFERGSLKALINCEVFTEGTDIANVGAIIMVRPAHSRALYKQMIGRGLRPDIDCSVIDHVGNYMLHGNVLTEDPLAIMENARLLTTQGVVERDSVVEAMRLELYVHKVENAKISRIRAPGFFRGI